MSLENAVRARVLTGFPFLAVEGQTLGDISDIVIELPTRNEDPLVSGLTVQIAGSDLFVPTGNLLSLAGTPLRLSSKTMIAGPFATARPRSLTGRDRGRHR